MANRRPADGTSGTKSSRAERRAAARRGTRANHASGTANQLARRASRFIVPGVLVVAVVAAAGIIVAGVTAPPAPVANIVRPVEGPASAPVTVAEYSDYQCDYCGRWAREVESSFRSRFVDAGEVRFEWHDMAWEGQESTDAANAARCAGDQGQFWAMHDLLYNSQNSTPNTGAFSKDRLKTLGATLGLDAAAYNACVDAGTYVAAVKADSAASSAAGFSGTPAFTVNGQVLVGYQTIDQLAAAIASAAPAAPAPSSAGPAASTPASTAP
jgi:protein-disulfide isomerase